MTKTKLYIVYISLYGGPDKAHFLNGASGSYMDAVFEPVAHNQVRPTTAVRLVEFIYPLCRCKLLSVSATYFQGSTMAVTREWRVKLCCSKFTFTSLDCAVR